MSISENVVMNLRNLQTEWCDGKSILEVQIKAKHYITKAKRDVPRYNQQQQLVTSNVKSLSSNKNPRNTNKLRDRNNSNSNTNGSNTASHNVDNIVAALKSTNDKMGYVEKYFRTNKGRFESTNFKRACSKADCWEQWKAVAKKHDIPFKEGDSRARRVYNNTQQPDWVDAFQTKMDSLVNQLSTTNTGSSPKAKMVKFKNEIYQPPKDDNNGENKNNSNDNTNTAISKYVLQKQPSVNSTKQDKSVPSSPSLSSSSSPASPSSSSSFSSSSLSTSSPTSSPPSSRSLSPPPVSLLPSLSSSSPLANVHPMSTVDKTLHEDIIVSKLIRKTETSWKLQPHQPTKIISHCKYNRRQISNMTSIEETQLKIVPDSGATDTMTGCKKFFQYITYYDVTSNEPYPTVILGDDTTEHPIAGYGWMDYTIKNKQIRQVGFYIPTLGDVTLLSIRQHMRYKGCYFHAEDNTATLAYPSFTIDLRIDPEIETNVSPTTNTSIPIAYDESTATLSPTTDTKYRGTKLQMMSANTTAYINPSQHVPSSLTSTVQIMKISETEIIPKRSTLGSIGYDVHAAAPTTIKPGDIGKIGTGLSVAFPNEMYLRIAPRSSLAIKHLTIEGGVVDSDYRGEIVVLMKNNSTTDYKVSSGQKIAQFIFEKADTPYLEVTTTLPPTQRGTGRFGSTDSPSKQTI